MGSDPSSVAGAAWTLNEEWDEGTLIAMPEQCYIWSDGGIGPSLLQAQLLHLVYLRLITVMSLELLALLSTSWSFTLKLICLPSC